MLGDHSGSWYTPAQRELQQQSSAQMFTFSFEPLYACHIVWMAKNICLCYQGRRLGVWLIGICLGGARSAASPLPHHRPTSRL